MTKAPKKSPRNRKAARELDVNKASPKELMDVLGIEKKTAALVARSRPFETVEDLLKKERVVLESKPEDLDRLVGLLKEKEKPPVFPVKSSVFEHRSGVTYGIEFFKDGSRRAFIKDALGTELVSVGLKGRKGSDPDYLTFRLIGRRPHELRRLDDASKRQANFLLHSKSAQVAGAVWKESLAAGVDADLAAAVKRLSQNLLMMQECTSPLTPKQMAEGCVTNGCTGVPDFDIKDCCDKHDICYWKGGTEADRLKCDVDFYNCIKGKGGFWHAVLAWIYYNGVRALGASHFNYQTTTEKPVPATPDTHPPTGTTTTTDHSKSCHVTVKLVEVQYNGADIGNDWEYQVRVDTTVTNIAEHIVNHPQSDFPDKTVFDGIKGKCGDTVSLEFSVNATEVDAGPNDRGHGGNTATFVCDGTEYSHSVTVSVTEDYFFGTGGTASMKFVFKIKTKCE